MFCVPLEFGRPFAYPSGRMRSTRSPIHSTLIEARINAGNEAAAVRESRLEDTKGPGRYSENIMTKDPSVLDPLGLTRQLCEIESTTYHEGAVGDFLAEFLAGRGWEVEKTPVPQPRRARWRAALERVRRTERADAGSGFFHAHGHGSAVHSFQRGCGVSLWPRGLRREGNYCGASCGRRSAARGGVSDWCVVCIGRRARFGGREGGQPQAQGQPISDQRRAN